MVGASSLGLATVCGLFWQVVCLQNLRNSSSGNNGQLWASEEEIGAFSGCRNKNMKNKPFKWFGTGHLNFIHIPRAAGTTVESCSKWFPGDRPNWGTMNGRIKGMKHIPDRREKCYGQHLPPAMFPAQSNPYSDRASNFCVVRNPYDRLVSQFGFVDVMSMKSKYTCDAKSLNTYLLASLKDVKAGKLFLGDCHFVPQALFNFGYDPKTFAANRNDKWCTHVIRFEHLAVEFNALMAKSGYGVRLSEAKISDSRHMGSKEDCRALGPKDLSPEVRKLANEIYKDDFELFGYSMSV
jgi:hypothetical protein